MKSCGLNEVRAPVRMATNWFCDWRPSVNDRDAREALDRTGGLLTRTRAQKARTRNPGSDKSEEKGTGNCGGLKTGTTKARFGSG